MFPESKSTSAKIGTSFSKTAAETVAIKLLGVVITSSPGFRFREI